MWATAVSYLAFLSISAKQLDNCGFVVCLSQLLGRLKNDLLIRGNTMVLLWIKFWA